MSLRFLSCLAKAASANGVKFLLGLVPGGEVLYEIAANTWQDYRQGNSEQALRAEIEALAQAPADQVRQQAQAAVAAQGAALTPEAQQALIGYLTQVPPMIRRSLRRPSDPSGTTAPADLQIGTVPMPRAVRLNNRTARKPLSRAVPSDARGSAVGT